MRMVGLIPARGGSKGIPRKNLASCAGESLLAWTARAALKAEKLCRVILSTDDPAIAKEGVRLGLDVPFMRPNSLAQDDTSMGCVLSHTLDWLDANNDGCDGIVLLQPTSPLRQARHIDEGVDIYHQKSPATVVSVVSVPHQFSPNSVLCESEGLMKPWADSPQIFRRQVKPKFWARNGPAVLIVRPEDVRLGRLYGDRVVGFEMDSVSSLDVDGQADLDYASWCLSQKGKPS